MTTTRRGTKTRRGALNHRGALNRLNSHNLKVTATAAALLAISFVGATTVGATTVGATTATGTTTEEPPSGTSTATGAKGQSITVTPVDGLPLTGGQVQVTGTGFSHNSGFYLALCADNGSDSAPSPCVGGAAMDGGAGSSYWISTNPPPFAIGLTEPLNQDGSFSLTLSISSSAEGIDCLSEGTKCVVSTRADHTQRGERGWDTKVPVSFIGQDPVIPPTTVPTPSTSAPTPSTSAPTNTTAPPATSTPGTSAPSTTPAPTSTLAANVLADSTTNQARAAQAASPGSEKRAEELAFTGTSSVALSVLAVLMILAGVATIRSSVVTAPIAKEEDQ